MTTDDAETRRAVIASYYGRFVARGDVLRSRTQGAFATISTFAGGLLGIGLLTNLPSLNPAARTLGVLTIGAWIIAALAFVFAATTSIKVDNSHNEDKNLANVLLDRIEVEQQSLERRFKAALVFGSLAVLSTVATLIVAVWQFPASSVQGASIQLAPAGTDLLVEQCEIPPTTEAIVDVRGLTSTSAFVDIVLAEDPGRGCHLLLPRTSVIGFKLD